MSNRKSNIWHTINLDGESVALDKLPYPDCIEKYYKILGAETLSQLIGKNISTIRSMASKLGVTQRRGLYKKTDEYQRASSVIDSVSSEGSRPYRREFELVWDYHRPLILKIAEQAVSNQTSVMNELKIRNETVFNYLLLIPANGVYADLAYAVKVMSRQVVEEERSDKFSVNGAEQFWAQYDDILFRVTCEALELERAALSYFKETYPDGYEALHSLRSNETIRARLTAIKKQYRSNLDGYFEQDFYGERDLNGEYVHPGFICWKGGIKTNLYEAGLFTTGDVIKNYGITRKIGIKMSPNKFAALLKEQDLSTPVISGNIDLSSWRPIVPKRRSMQPDESCLFDANKREPEESPQLLLLKVVNNHPIAIFKFN